MFDDVVVVSRPPSGDYKGFSQSHVKRIRMKSVRFIRHALSSGSYRIFSGGGSGREERILELCELVRLDRRRAAPVKFGVWTLRNGWWMFSDVFAASPSSVFARDCSLSGVVAAVVVCRGGVFGHYSVSAGRPTLIMNYNGKLFGVPSSLRKLHSISKSRMYRPYRRSGPVKPVSSLLIT